MLDLPLVREVDAAEEAGDVATALTLMVSAAECGHRDLLDLWHRDRLERLVQIARFGRFLPGWAISRWLLAQAKRSMRESQRQRHRRAFERTLEVAGGLTGYPGSTEIDKGCQLMDHDWVYRQLLLYDDGGLRDFLDQADSSVLLDRADRIGDWASVPMGAFQLIEEEATSLTWLNLSSREEIEIANIGSASMLDIGDHVIGRMVPIQDSAMFESAPLFVPEPLARQVAASPADWTAALQGACREGARVPTLVGGFPLLSDVPQAHRLMLIDSLALTPDDPDEPRGDDLLWDFVDVILTVMNVCPELDELAVNAWPVVASLLLTPAVTEELVQHPWLGSADGFRRIAARMAAPASDIATMLARERDLVA